MAPNYILNRGQNQIIARGECNCQADNLLEEFAKEW